MSETLKLSFDLGRDNWQATNGANSAFRPQRFPDFGLANDGHKIVWDASA